MIFCESECLISTNKYCSVVFVFSKDQRKEPIRDEMYLFVCYELRLRFVFANEKREDKFLVVAFFLEPVWFVDRFRLGFGFGSEVRERK